MIELVEITVRRSRGRGGLDKLDHRLGRAPRGLVSTSSTTGGSTTGGSTTGGSTTGGSSWAGAGRWGAGQPAWSRS
ncbi:hypothetical protein E3O48_17265 [Cryobacterium sp. HLT2-28]|nr:hypothetical protein E3O48_17265 [Cryobacterium sp. HLT2-28]